MKEEKREIVLIKDIKNNKLKITKAKSTKELIEKRAKMVEFIRNNGKQIKDNKNQYIYDNCKYEIVIAYFFIPGEIITENNKEYIQYKGWNGKEILYWIDGYEHTQKDSFGTIIFNLKDFINWQFNDYDDIYYDDDF